MSYTRLTERVNKGQVKFILKDGENPIEKFQNALDRLAELEDKIEQGKLREVLFKKGDILFMTDGINIYEIEVRYMTVIEDKIIYCTPYIDFDERAIGNSVFLTREEAEKRLKELQE